MIRQNLHTHTVFSDGKNTAEEMVLAAIQKDFASLGFSEHAFAPYDGDCCIKQADIPAYFAEITRLKQKYAGKIAVYLGFEYDSYYPVTKTGLDYTIGSAHYIYCEKTGEYFPVDYRHDSFGQALDKAADGDIRRLVGMYYENLLKMAVDYQPDILGHIDLITRLNEDGRYFDPKSAWYRAMMEEAAKKIAASGCIVEVNTGGMYRGGLKEPYPSPEFLELLCGYNVPLTIASDAHSADSLDYWFDEAVGLLKSLGCHEIRQLTPDGFVSVEL